MAYELLAAKGFKDGMVPYISNQYEDDAKQNGKTISIYGKTRGLVTDDLVLRKVFNGQFNNWTEFKKAMYEERKNKFDSLNKVTFDDTRQPWTSYATKTISTVEELQTLMDEAVLKDAMIIGIPGAVINQNITVLSTSLKKQSSKLTSIKPMIQNINL